MKRMFYLLLAIMLAGAAHAQQTGSFQNSVTFNEPDYNATRTLYYHVPTDYDPANSYKLIVGFRGGPHSNAGQYRDQLQPLSDLLDAIILCPENSAEFTTGPESNAKPLFNHSVATAMQEYNIDSNFIYITGLSYGGRHTIIASMDDDSGPISDNIRGIIPFAPGTNTENVADYNNSDRFPVCTCIGSNDGSFMNVAQAFHSNVVANGGAALFNEIPNIGHTTAFPSFIDEMMECFNFIEGQYTTPVHEVGEETALRVYPNPSLGNTTVEWHGGTDGSYELQVFDQLGRNIRRLPLSGNMVSLRDLPKGIFHLVLTKDGIRVASRRGIVAD